MTSFDFKVDTRYGFEVFTSPNAPKEDKIASEIKNLSSIPDGWDYGFGYAPKEDVINKALELYSIGKLNGFESEVSPTTNGGIILLFAKKENFLEVSISNTLELSYRHEVGYGVSYDLLEESEDVDKYDIYLKLREISKSLECQSLERYTLKNTAKREEGLAVIASPISILVSPFSTLNVQKANRVIYVTTFPNTTFQPLVHQ